jgi:hypothetical protein
MSQAVIGPSPCERAVSSFSFRFSAAEIEESIATQ